MTLAMSTLPAMTMFCSILGKSAPVFGLQNDGGSHPTTAVTYGDVISLSCLSPPSDATPPLLRPSGESKAIPSGKVLELLPGVLQ